ncbi:hypothetical protein D3C72_2313040 [compost metagenome]
MPDRSRMPSALTGNVVLSRDDANGVALADLHLTSFICHPALKTIDVKGEARNPRGDKTGTYVGQINLRTGKWLGSYEATGKPKQTLDLTGVMEQLL